MVWLALAKFQPSLFCFMFRLLNLLLCKCKMRQLDSKVEAKYVSYDSTSKAYDCLNNILSDLPELTAKREIVICKCYL